MERNEISHDHFRVGPRHAVYLRATLKLEGGPWQSDATVLNVGPRGACLAVARTPPEGAAVSVALTLPGARGPLALRGRIQWVRGPTSEPARVGLSFEPESARDTGRLLEAVVALS